jgi:Flp pilus assembly protein CpaB
MPSGTPDQRKSQIIIENVRVLAVGKTIVDEDTETPEPYQTITLEVNPQDGATLTLATSIGQIVLMLRGNEKER